MAQKLICLPKLAFNEVEGWGDSGGVVGWGGVCGKQNSEMASHSTPIPDSRLGGLSLSTTEHTGQFSAESFCQEYLRLLLFFFMEDKY